MKKLETKEEGEEKRGEERQNKANEKEEKVLRCDTLSWFFS